MKLIDIMKAYNKAVLRENAKLKSIYNNLIRESEAKEETNEAKTQGEEMADALDEEEIEECPACGDPSCKNGEKCGMLESDFDDMLSEENPVEDTAAPASVGGKPLMKAADFFKMCQKETVTENEDDDELEETDLNEKDPDDEEFEAEELEEKELAGKDSEEEQNEEEDLGEGDSEEGLEEDDPEEDLEEGDPEEDLEEGDPEEDLEEGDPEEDLEEGDPEEDIEEDDPEKEQDEGENKGMTSQQFFG